MREIDMVGQRCPTPIVKLNGEFRTLAPGEDLLMLANDPAFEMDVQAWCRRTGNLLLGFESRDGVFRAHLRKQG
ncbi:MAG: sulfurtransferase TusA family protein [Gammaproteobacteria bacterium]